MISDIETRLGESTRKCIERESKIRHESQQMVIEQGSLISGLRAQFEALKYQFSAYPVDIKEQ